MRILVTGKSGVIGAALCRRSKLEAERPRYAGECIMFSIAV